MEFIAFEPPRSFLRTHGQIEKSRLNRNHRYVVRELLKGLWVRLKSVNIPEGAHSRYCNERPNTNISSAVDECLISPQKSLQNLKITLFFSLQPNHRLVRNRYVA